VVIGESSRLNGAPSGTPGRLAGLDGVRGLAVLIVVMSHAQFRFFGPGGIQGVTTFFALSGFLITGLLLKEFRQNGRIDLLSFWGRRALRLLPALFAFVGVTGLVFLVIGWIDRRTLVVVVKPVLLYYGNLHVIAGGSLGPFQHTWSLAVEEQFYLVWPLLLSAALLLLRGRRRAALWLVVGFLTLTALSVGWRLYAGMVLADRTVAHAPHTTVFSMTAGAALAVAYQRGWRPGRWAGAGAVLVVSAYFWLPPLIPRYAGWVTGPVIYTLLAIGLVACALGEHRTILSARPLRALGTVSYGWYLWHFPLILMLITRHARVRHLTAALWLAVIGSLVVAALSWRYLEQPLQRRFRRRLERAQLVEGTVQDGGGQASTGQSSVGEANAARGEGRGNAGRTGEELPQEEDVWSFVGVSGADRSSAELPQEDAGPFVGVSGAAGAAGPDRP
jgi:peptidoglycan/LPS O-acetylase OafA/YrhL